MVVVSGRLASWSPEATLEAWPSAGAESGAAWPAAATWRPPAHQQPAWVPGPEEVAVAMRSRVTRLPGTREAEPGPWNRPLMAYHLS